MNKIFSLTYNQDSRNFNRFCIFKSASGLKFGTDFKSPISLALFPQMIQTSYKFHYPDSVNTLSGDKLKQELSIINGLMDQCPGVPVLDAINFNNACYIKDLDKIWKEASEPQRNWFVKEFGVVRSELEANLKPHMVFLGPKFKCAVVLAHEFGHYLNTIGKGEVGGQEAHERYSSSIRNSSLAKYIADLAGTLNLMSTPFANKSKATKIYYNATGLISIVSNLIIPITSRHIIKSETLASKTAMKNLAKLNSDERDTTKYEEFLDGALKTYIKAYRTKPLIIGTVEAAIAAAVAII